MRLIVILITMPVFTPSPYPEPNQSDISLGSGEAHPGIGIIANACIYFLSRRYCWNHHWIIRLPLFLISPHNKANLSIDMDHP